MGAQTATTSSGVLIPPPILYVVTLAIAWLLNHRWPIRFGSPPGTWILGAILILLAFIIAFSAFPLFVRAKTAISVRQPTTALITTGLYRFSRNPLYVGLTMAYLGAGIASNAAAWTLVLLPILFITVQTQVIAREERYLEQRFGQAYLDYKARVRRWL